ncbi:MAG: GntR family transcriptional regulator [Faecalibacterium sp.]
MQQPAKQSLKLQAYQYLRDKILSCEYAPGERLNEQQLCAEMGNISRTPMRDAISRLEQEGLITILPKKGLMVAQVKAEDIQYIYEVRLLIEPYALRRYGSAISRAALEACRAQLLAQQSQASRAAFCAADDAFHALMLGALENPYLRGTYANIAALNSRVRLLSDKQALYRTEQTVAEHLAVLDACIIGDYQAAADAMELHLQKGRQAAFEVPKK